MSDGEAAAVAKALNAQHKGDHWMASCPCPRHVRGDRRPSLSIREGDDGRLLLNCFAGCTWDDITNAPELRGVFTRKKSRLSTARHALAASQGEPTRAEPDQNALRIWRDSISIYATPVAKYLDGRGINSRPSALRCCYHDDEHVGMIAAVHRSDGELIAAQVKMVTRDGLKVPESRPDTIGQLGDGAVRLGPPAEVMGICEGVETGLSAMMLAEMPLWAALGSKRLHRVALPSLVSEVHIFCDNDEAGHAGAQRAAELHQKAGRRVYLRCPPAGNKDYNDLLVALRCDGGAT